MPQQGKVKKLIVDKGFGFIEGENGEFFFHGSSLIEGDIGDISEGTVVEFEATQGPKGPRAENVKIVG